jgi:CheY-like chemotaxis protein
MRILVIDNDSDMREIYKGIIEIKTDYLVDVAESGIAGLEKMRNSDPYDLLILDLMMPEMNGIEVCKAMINDEKMKHIPVLISSGLPVFSQPFLDSIKQFEELHIVVDTLEKPFTPESLIEKVNKVLHVQDTPAAPPVTPA